MITLTKEKLDLLLPANKNTEALATVLNNILPKYEINTVYRIAGFIAQCGHESVDFTVLKENLNYGAAGLRAVFPKYFNNTTANEYARQPIKIANKIYANRMGNGDEASGDGYKYRGRGAIQLTGKNNYTLFANSINKTLDETIAYLETLEGAIESACWFWSVRKLNSTCDANDIVHMTKIINGGIHGLNDRSSRYANAKGVLS